MLEREVRQLLDTPAVAHLATLLPDGSPHSTPVWVGVEGDRVAVLTSPASRKARNLRRDPRVALSLTRVDDPFTPVMIRGQVVEWLDGDPAWAVVDRIAGRYIGQPYPRGEDRVVALIEVEAQRVGVGS